MHNLSINRRQLARSVAVLGIGATWGSTVARHSMARDAESLSQGSRILFQGDSITDARRDRKAEKANDAGGLGNGYPYFAAGHLLREHPELQLEVLNRGVSGNKVPDLQARWQTECIDLKPNLISILIGVNDLWHKLNGRYAGTVEDYVRGFRKLIEETQSKLPDSRIVICEPFVLKCGAVNDKWFPEFDERREAAVQLAADCKLTLIPFQQMFNQALEQAPAEYWAADGVHPSVAGHALMAEEWCEILGF